MPIKNRYEFDEATKRWVVFFKANKVKYFDTEIEARGYFIRKMINLNKE